MNFPSKEVVQRIRETYPVGCRVELIGMGPDPYSKLERICELGLRLRAGYGLWRRPYPTHRREGR